MQHLSRPEKPLPDFEDIAPRLDMIERALAESREAIINAAREAAESAIRSYSPSEGGDAAALGGLADDLQSLERLARKSDERNTRTFEAIHDTLLKVVDRLGTLEGGAEAYTGEAPVERAPSQLEFATAPSLDLDEAAPLEGAPLDEVKVEAAPMIGLKGRAPKAEVARDPKRSPAEAAAAAALAALSSETAQSAPRPKLKKSKLSGLSRALTRKKGPNSEPQVEKEQDEAAAENGIPEVSLDAPLDPKLANQPLEPGSGAPDLNAIMKRVRDERGEEGRARDAEAAKSDFIAAARRAAQAAAAEADVLKNKSDTKRASSGFSLKKLLRTNSKMVIVAAGVVLIGIAGMQLGKAFFKHDGHSVAAVKAASKMASSDKPAKAKPVKQKTASANEAAAPKAAEMTPIMVQPEKTAPTAIRSADSGQDAIKEQASAAKPGQAAAVRLAGPATVQTDGAKMTAETSVKPDGAADGPKMAAIDKPIAQSSGANVSQSAIGNAGQKAPAATVASADASDSTSAAPAMDAGAKSASVATAAMSVPVDAGPLPLREAAQNGDPKAMFVIGTRYADGRGVASDMKAAAKWYEQSAGLGFAPAQYRIGNFYEKGLGVTRDISKAENWYKMAADQGNASAMHNLAVLYAMGAAGKVDNESAVRWFEKAAELGVKDSQFNLGILAAKGVGMKQDLEESYKWFALVAKTGDRDAAAKRDEIANSLRPEQLQKARAATELWKAKPVNAAANVVDVPEEWKESDAKTASIDMKQAVKNIQLILNKNGYQAGTPDGIMGDKTKTAIAAFQKDNGMEATGEVNENLVNALLKKK